MRETLLTATIQSSILFGFIWIVFRLFPAISANAKAWTWRIAFVKPLVALFPLATIALNVLPAPKEVEYGPVEPVSTEEAYAPESKPASMPRSPEPSKATLLSPPAGALSEGRRIDPLIVGWLLGMGVVMGFGLLDAYRLGKIVATSEELDQPNLQEVLRGLLRKARLRRPVRLLVSESVPTAVLVGGRRYSIVLPKELVQTGSYQDLRLMLAHEVAHIARRDMGWLSLAYVAQVLFFFNPMVWVAIRSSRLDHESATDRYASQLAEAPIKTYAEMLLRATVTMRAPLAPGGLPVGESFHTIHQRLQAMKHFEKKPTFIRRAGASALVMITLTLLPGYRLVAGETQPETILSEPFTAGQPWPLASKAKVGKHDEGEIQTKIARSFRAKKEDPSTIKSDLAAAHIDQFISPDSITEPAINPSSDLSTTQTYPAVKIEGVRFTKKVDGYKVGKTSRFVLRQGDRAYVIEGDEMEVATKGDEYLVTIVGEKKRVHLKEHRIMENAPICGNECTCAGQDQTMIVDEPSFFRIRITTSPLTESKVMVGTMAEARPYSVFRDSSLPRPQGPEPKPVSTFKGTKIKKVEHAPGVWVQSVEFVKDASGTMVSVTPTFELTTNEGTIIVQSPDMKVTEKNGLYSIAMRDELHIWERRSDLHIWNKASRGSYDWQMRATPGWTTYITIYPESPLHYQVSYARTR